MKQQPAWQPLISEGRDLWRSALKAPKDKKILIATINSDPNVITLESLLAIALTLRGAEVRVLLCDSALPACFDCSYRHYPTDQDQKHFLKYGPTKELCRRCFLPANRIYRALGIKVHRFSEFVTPQDQNEAENISAAIPFSEIGKYRLDELAIGEHALAGALRFFARGSLDEEPYGEGVLRCYLQAALLTSNVMQKVLRKNVYDCVVSLHGIYVPSGVIGEVCRKNNVRVANWNTGYKKKCFIFSHRDTYHHTMMSEPTEKWANLKWNDQLESELMSYLKSRWEGKKDWIWFHEKPKFELSEIADELKIDLSKPCIGMLTSVVWDAQLHYPSNAFPNQFDWVFKTIDYFKRRPDLQLIIRIHPAEVRGALPSRQRVADAIGRRFPALPPNVVVVPPESNASTYALMQKCDSVIIYNTKTGIELSAMGIPVVVAGEAWIKNKGFAIDINDQVAYFKVLDGLPLGRGMSKGDIRKAKKYAYHFFFRRKIPLEFMVPTDTIPVFKVGISSLSELRPGKSKGLDIVCKGILEGTDFIYPSERYTSSPK